jgi:wobble nucleotide-excising tRNase
MLTKINKIKGIGVYHDYSSSGEGLNFKKNTAIYAENGYGKSTLVAVIRSMIESNPDIIIGRPTLGKNLNQFAIINVTGGTVKFENGLWSTHTTTGHCPELIIFDEQYVQDNLFVKEIEAGHKKKIYQLVIGEEGKQIANLLNNLITEEKDKRRQLQELNKLLEKKNKAANVLNYLEIEEGLADEAKVEIKYIDKQLTIIKNAEEIKSLLNFDSIDPPQYDLEELRKSLMKSLEDIHTRARAEVENHIQDHLNQSDHAEEFIRLGYQLQKEVCPYCGQSLENALDLMNAYQSYFDEAYNTFQQDLEKQIKKVEAWDLSGEISRIQRWTNNCENNITQLRHKISENGQPELTNLHEKYKERANEVHKNLLTELQSKLLNPALVTTDFSLNEFNDFLTSINGEIEAFESELASIKEDYSKLIDTQKEQSIDDLEISKKTYQKRIDRFSEDEVDWCNDYRRIKGEAENLGKERDVAAQKLSKYTEEIFKKFEKSVNSYLKLLRAQFTINDIKQKTDNTSSEVYVTFSIGIQQECVPLKSLARSPKPEFSNTLSNGDRNTLSLAFFLSWLDSQSELNNKIVVFDDPLTSMDNNRRLGTAKVLGALSDKVMQLIVLTHKEDFLFQLDDEVSKLHGLNIECDQTNGSRILPYDIKYNRKDIHFRRIDEMKRYLSEDFGPRVKDMQENIRLVLERVLKLKYYPDLATIITLGSMIDYLEKNSLLEEDTLKKLRDLNKTSSSVHHAEEAGRPIQNINRVDLLPEIEETLELLKKL